MILQALKEYYDRKAADPESGIAPLGWEWKEFLFTAEIGENGRFMRFHSFGEQDGRRIRGKRFLVPSLGEKKGSGIKANLLWENIEYMFGIPMPTATRAAPSPLRLDEQHHVFIARLRGLPGASPVLDALRAFADIDNAEAAKTDPLWQEVREANRPVLLAVNGAMPVTDDPSVRTVVAQLAESAKTDGFCPVAGSPDRIAVLEPPIKGVVGADRKAERALVSFNLPAFESFGKKKNHNAPVGKQAVLAYATALNHLMREGSRQRLVLGDMTVVFWAARGSPSGFEDFFGDIWSDNPDRNTPAVEALFRSPQSGAFVTDTDATRFHVLCLAPNAARIVVRSWVVSTVANIAGRIRQHFDDTKITHKPHEPETLSLDRLLRSTAFNEERDRILPNVGGDTMRAILEGLPYPQTLLQVAIRRVRAEQSRKDSRTGKPVPNVPYPRAALIKACVNRETRRDNTNKEEELAVSLDEDSTNIGYRLGRLFAALERLQIRAFTQNGGKEPNSTIRDRYYGAASSTPAAVFGTLTRLSKHHLAKLENVGERVNTEKRIGSIMQEIQDFPAHLPLADQGRFAIGYYHQMFERKADTTDKEAAQ